MKIINLLRQIIALAFINGAIAVLPWNHPSSEAALAFLGSAADTLAA